MCKEVFFSVGFNLVVYLRLLSFPVSVERVVFSILIYRNHNTACFFYIEKDLACTETVTLLEISMQSVAFCFNSLQINIIQIKFNRYVITCSIAGVSKAQSSNDTCIIEKFHSRWGLLIDQSISLLVINAEALHLPHSLWSWR